VPKKDGEEEIVNNNSLNAITKKNSYLPLTTRIEDVFNKLRNSKYFSILDLGSGFYQIEMEEELIEKTAFISREGRFQLKVLPYGLCNAHLHFID